MDFEQLLNLPIIPDLRILVDMAARLFLAAFLGTLLAYSRKPDRYRLNLIEAHALLAIAGAMFMVIIAGSVVTAVGLLGAASIVRYRYAIRSPRDASTLILSLGLGMACGTDRVEVAVAGAVLILIVRRMLIVFPDALPAPLVDRHENRILRLRSTDHAVTSKRIQRVFKAHGITHHLVTMEQKARREPGELVTLLELRVELGRKADLNILTSEITGPELKQINWQESP